MVIIPHLLTHTELLSRLKQRLRDPSSQRWTEAELMNALNDGIENWGRRVLTPYLYTVVGGWGAGVYEYSLPVYITEPLDVQQKKQIWLDDVWQTSSDLENTTWVDMPAWSLEPDGAGGQKIRFDITPYETEGRVIWWGRNSALPMTTPTLASGISSTDTSCTLDAVYNVGPSGYIKIDQEVMQFAGVSESATQTTLTNLVRGANGTTAAAHDSADNVLFCLAVHRQDLYQQLIFQAIAALHALYLTDASPHETEHHQFQMRYWQGMAEDFWRRYQPARSPKMTLARRGWTV